MPKNMSCLSKETNFVARNGVIHFPVVWSENKKKVWKLVGFNSQGKLVLDKEFSKMVEPLPLANTFGVFDVNGGILTFNAGSKIYVINLKRSELLFTLKFKSTVTKIAIDTSVLVFSTIRNMHCIKLKDPAYTIHQLSEIKHEGNLLSSKIVLTKNCINLVDSVKRGNISTLKITSWKKSTFDFPKSVEDNLSEKDPVAHSFSEQFLWAHSLEEEVNEIAGSGQIGTEAYSDQFFCISDTKILVYNCLTGKHHEIVEQRFYELLSSVKTRDISKKITLELEFAKEKRTSGKNKFDSVNEKMVAIEIVAVDRSNDLFVIKNQKEFVVRRMSDLGLVFNVKLPSFVNLKLVQQVSVRLKNFVLFVGASKQCGWDIISGKPINIILPHSLDIFDKPSDHGNKKKIEYFSFLFV